MGDITGFLKYGREPPGPPAGAGAPARLEGGLRAVPRRGGPAAGGPVHGLRHPLLPRGLSARQPHPRVERPGLPGRLVGGHRAPARHQQLPRVHRPAVPGAVRGVVRARHQRRPGHHRADRVRDHRAGLGRGVGATRSRPPSRPASGWRWWGRARPGWPPPSSWPGPATRWWSSSGPNAPAGSCATGSPSSRWRRPCSTAAWTRCGPRGSSSVCRGERGGVRPRDAVGPRPRTSPSMPRRPGSTSSTPWCWPAAPPCPGTCRSRAGSCAGVHRAMDYLKPSNLVQEGALAAIAHLGRGQARGHHRRRGHRGRLPRHRPPAAGASACTSSRSCPSPPTERDRRQPVADVAAHPAHLVGARGGRRAGLLR